MIDKKSLARLYLFGAITVIFILLILGKYFSVMLLNNKDNHSIVGTNTVVERGPILDRNGRVLAIQNRLDSVEAWIPYIDKPDATAAILGTILNLNKDALLRDFETKPSSIWIKRKITPTESKAVKKYKEKGELHGIYLKQEYGRNYPENKIACHVLGYAGTDNTGLDGIEYILDEVLSPSLTVKTEKDIYGNQLFLTIDLNIQFFAEKYATEAFKVNDADSVMVLIMDAKNADILGYVSIPDFDPNLFNTYSDSERKNRPVSSAYEPGSVFKIFSLASFMEIGGVTIYDHFYCNGSYTNEYISEPIKCLGHHGDVTLKEIIKFSCNAGAAYASDTAGREEFYQMLISFGFGSTTGLPLPGESHGFLRGPKNWSSRSKPTLSFGQEILVSAVQMVSAATVFTNNGTLLKPHILHKIVSPKGNIIKENKREPLRKVVSSDIAQSILLMMEGATEHGGTAFRVKIDGIRISAKTGTAQMLDPKTGKYSKTAFIPSCLAIFPTDDPEFIIYVVINNPKAGEYYGGRIAAPVVKNISEELITYYRLPRKTDTVIYHSGTIKIEQNTPLEIGSIMPDLSGFSKKELLPLFQDKRITLKIKGEGWVVHQSPAPGTKITDSIIISLELE